MPFDKFRAIWFKMISFRVREGMALAETTKILITNGASWFLLILCPLFIALNLLQGHYSLAGVNGATTLLGALCLFLTVRGHYRTAPILMVSLGGVLFFCSGLFFNNGMEYTLLVAILATTLMFESAAIRISLVLANGIGFLAVKAIHLQEGAPVGLPPARVLTNIVVFLITFYWLLEVFRTVNNNYHREIEEKNADLARSRRQLDKEHSELMVRTSELKEANLAKERLFSIVAHDLRGPVGNLKMTVEHLETGLFSTSDFQKVVSALKVEVDHAYDCLDTLLAWSASQLRGIQPFFTAAPLAAIARSCTALLADNAVRKRITVEMNVTEEARVWADEDQLASILRNLLSNALKFTPVGGTVEISAVEENGSWRVQVSDTGVGMTEERQLQLFDPNNATSTPGTEQEKGLGLGLQICQEFIQSHGGVLSVESREGCGTTFHFTLAAPKDEAATTEVV